MAMTKRIPLVKKRSTVPMQLVWIVNKGTENNLEEEGAKNG